MDQFKLDSHFTTAKQQSYIPVLDKKHFSPKRKLSFEIPEKMATSKPSKIPISQNSPGPQDHHKFCTTNPIIRVTPDTKTPDKKQSSMQATQVVDNLTSDKKMNIILETSATSNDLSSSLRTNGGKSIDSGFMDEKNKQKVDIQSLPFSSVATEVANVKNSSTHIEPKCFMPLEEVDQGITRAASQGSLASTTSSTSLDEMVGDERSSSGCDSARMSKPSKSHDWTQLNRPRSACDDYIMHDLDEQMKRHDSLPQLDSSSALLVSKINLLQKEKEALESELQLYKSKNLLAQSEIKTLQNREVQLKETIDSLHTSFGEVNDDMDKLKQSNVLEVNRLKRNMSSEHDRLVTELNAQIRQLTLEREEALAQVTSLHYSLSETQAALRKACSKECDGLAASATQAEVDSLQMELKALKAFTAEGESARAALQSNLTKLNKQISDLQSEKSDLLLQLEDKNATSTNTIVSELKQKLLMMEEQLSSAARDKSKAVAEVEQRMTTEIVKQKLQSEELRQLLKHNEGVIDIQNKKMEEMEKELCDATSKPKTRRSPGTLRHNSSPEKEASRKMHKDQSQSPPPRNISFSGSSLTFPSFGRWTAHRAYVKKHAGEMQTIMTSLAKEGFSPGSSSVDEVIRHLWWKKEYADSKYHLAEKTIKKMSSGDTKLALREWKQNLSELEAKIESGEEDDEQIQKRKQELDQAIERQLHDLILVKQQAVDECAALKQSAEASDQRNFELEERNLALENELSKSYKTSVILQEKLEYTKKQHENGQSELKLEKKQINLLKAEINTLKYQLDQQKEQLARYYADRDKAIEELDKTGADMQQTKQYSVKLEAKVNQLENDLKAAEQKYSISNEHKVALEEQLDEIRVQKCTLENMLEKEKNSKRSIQQELDQLSLDHQQKVQALNSTSVRENNLKVEVLNLQKNLQITQQHLTELETELSVAHIKNTELQNQLTQKENYCNQLTSEVSALSMELESSQNACNTLQSSLSNYQSKHNSSSKEVGILTVEKEELQTRLTSILNDLDSAHKKLEVSGKEKSEHVHVMAIKDQQLLEVEAEKSKLLSESRENKAVLQNMQENLHKIVDEKNAEIFKLKQDKLTTVAELTVAEKKIEIMNKELLKLRTQLEESNDSFLKEKRSLTEELSSTSEQKTRLSNELVQKDEVLAGKEAELLNFKSENNQLTNELSIAKDKIHQANLSDDKLQSRLVTLTQEISAKTRHIESLENDMSVIRQHIESLNQKMKENSTDRQTDEALLHDSEQESQIVKLLNTLQQEIHDVTKAKHDLEAQVSSLSEEKKSNERRIQELQEEIESLRTELIQTKEQLCNEAYQLREKLQEEAQGNSEKMARSQQDFQKICNNYEHRISEVKSKCLLLESQLGQKESALRIAESENSSLKSRIAMASTDLETTLAANRSLEKALSEMRETTGQQQSKLMQETLEYRSNNENLNMEIMSLKSQVTQANQNLETAKTQLKEDKKHITKLKCDLQVAMKTTSSLSSQLQHSREECQMLTTNMKSLNDGINNLKMENAQLQERLKEKMSELSAAQKATSDGDKKFNSALMVLQSRLEEEKVKASSEKQQLLTEMTELRKESGNQQDILHQTQQELHHCHMTLERCDKMRGELEATLQSEIKYREDLQARYHNVENDKDLLRVHMEQIKTQINVKEEKCNQMELQLQKAQKDYGGLLEQLQIQREAAAGSLNKLQQKNKEQITELQAKTENLTMELQGVQSNLKNTELSAKSLSSDNNLLTREIVELRSTCDVLKTKLREEESSLKLSQHKIEQLCVSLELEKQSKNKCQEEINELQVVKSSLQSKLVVEKDKVRSTKAEKDAVEEILNSERSLIVSLRNEVSQLKLQLKTVSQEVEVEKQSHLSSSQNSTKELLRLKEKFNEEKKGFKLKIKELNNRVIELESEIQKKELDLARVKDANYDLTEERVQLTTKLTETERKSRERKEEIQKLRMQNHEVELKVSQLQLEINTLQQMQVEWEHYKKKLEASSRAEVQHVLAEVTEHMAQQHCAHKSLEKLRAENETLAIKEKERKIHHLKTELRQAKHDLKHDQMHIGNLELETALLKSQKKDQERARKRLEVKLHSMNNTLTNSLRSPSRSYERPQAISTPQWNNSLSDMNSL